MDTNQIVSFLLRTLEVGGVLGATYFAAKTAKLAHKSLVEQRKNEEPNVIVYIRQSNNSLNIIDLVIRNEGIRSAKYIKFKVTGTNIGALTDRKIKDIGLIKNGVALLAGGQEIVQPLGVMLGDSYKEYKKSKTKIKVAYESRKNYEKTDIFPLDFKGLIDRKLGKSDIESISRPLKDIQNELHTIKKDIHLIANKGITRVFPQPAYSEKHDVTEELE